MKLINELELCQATKKVAELVYGKDTFCSVEQYSDIASILALPRGSKVRTDIIKKIFKSKSYNSKDIFKIIKIFNNYAV